MLPTKCNISLTLNKLLISTFSPRFKLLQSKVNVQFYKLKALGSNPRKKEDFFRSKLSRKKFAEGFPKLDGKCFIRWTEYTETGSSSFHTHSKMPYGESTLNFSCQVEENRGSTFWHKAFIKTEKQLKPQTHTIPGRFSLHTPPPWQHL